MNNPKVLLVEDKKLQSETLSHWIKGTGFDILGPYAKKTEAIKCFNENKENIVAGVIDLKLPNPDNSNLRDDPSQGFEIVKLFRDNKIPVIIISDEIFIKILEDGIKCGCSYIYKDDMNDESMLIEIIDVTIKGCIVFTDTVKHELIRIIDKKNLTDPLDNTQWKILSLRKKGQTINEVALKLNFADSTIRQKCSEIFKIIKVSNMIEATRWFDMNIEKFGHKELLD